MKFLLLTVAFLCLVTMAIARKRGIAPDLNYVCTGNSGSNLYALDIDCTGFVQCSESTAYWIACPENQYFDGIVSCSKDDKICPNATEFPKVAQNRCGLNKQLSFPHPESCAMFYQCNRTTIEAGFAMNENECSFPMLFDSATWDCKNPKMENVTCQAPKPIDQCSYRRECGSPTCTGRPDGDNEYQNQVFDVEYVKCKNEQIVSTHRCEIPGEIFDPIQRICTANYEASIEPYCMKYPTAKFADPKLCSLFYDCTVLTPRDGLGKYRDECAYLYLFNPVTTDCELYSSVMCGLRKEPIAPCDYSTGNGRFTCEESCKGLPDGDNIYPGRALTKDYIVCFDQRTYNTKECLDGKVFDPDSTSCSYEIGTDALDNFCASNPTTVIPHPGQCSQFYDCQKLTSSGNFPKYLRECFFMELYDPVAKDCKSADTVNCQLRQKPVTMCDYLQFQCVGSTNCVLCPDNMPSCVGKQDGYYSLVGEEMTAKYIECKGSKFVNVHTCPRGQLFDMYSKICTASVTSEAMTAFCAMKPGTVDKPASVANPVHCGQYYECPQNVSLKADLLECPYPSEYSIYGRGCREYGMVDCSDRIEKVAPCDYALINPCSGAVNCSCELPSCEVQADGHVGPFPGSSTRYYTCRDRRTYISNCAPKNFDPAIGRCEGTPPPEPTTTAIPTTQTPGQVVEITTTQAPEPTTTSPVSQTPASPPTEPELQKAMDQCSANPTLEAIPHGVNCHWFYNCSNLQGVSECSYPYLFDTQSQRCVEYSLASCSGTFKPQEMCQYDQYRRKYPICQPNVFCGECDTHHPSCVGKQDNYRAGLKFDNTQYYECRDNRTIAYQCDPGLIFNGGICTKAPADINEASSAAEASELCIFDQTALLPHRDDCALYFDCENSRVAVEKGCQYPKQFDIATKTCMESVNCGTRPESKTPCSYKTVRAEFPGCAGFTSCPDCDIEYPSCVGKPDNYRGAIVSNGTKYFICKNERTYIVKCTAGQVYVQKLQDCGPDFDARTTMASTVAEASQTCVLDQTALIPNKDHCGRYFTCNNTKVATEAECPYPESFDVDLKSCSMTAPCGVRPEIKEPCAYLTVLDRYTICEKGKPCQQCEEDHPSCVGRPENYKGPILRDPSSFYICLNERTFIRECINPGTIFLPAIDACGPDPHIPLQPLTPANVVVECAQHPKSVYPMEGSCARYYDCKVGPNGVLGPYTSECPYPQLFDGFDGRCYEPTKAKCGARYIEIDRCEYLAIRKDYCSTPGNCVTCEVENPSCRNKPDYFIGGITINDAMFHTCINSRTTISNCASNQVFNKALKQCQDIVTTTPAPVVSTTPSLIDIIYPTDIIGYCSMNPYSFAAHPESCALYWNCSYVPTLSQPMYYTNYLMECRYPLYFNRLTGICDENFDSVDCTSRKEVIAPCEFIAFTKALCQNLTSCAFCENAQLSCRGKTDGYKDSMPQHSNQYFECRNQRTTIGTCPDGQFFDSVRARCQVPSEPTIPVMSTIGEAREACRQAPTAKFPHAKNCAQFFDCTVKNGPYGDFLSECPYPDLFDPRSSICMAHSLVACGTRYEPRLRCEYFAILTKYCRILGTNCPECDRYNPSCIAQRDDLRGEILDSRTDYYTCVKERTIIKTCPPTYEFDKATRNCILLRPLSSSAEALNYCKNNPMGIYPSTVSCAQYFNCSQTSYGRFGRYLMECAYPDVFNIESRSCADPVGVNCTGRPVLKNPCDYMGNMEIYTGKKCILPSCVGKLNGRHHYPGKELQRDYIQCLNNRLVSVQTCPARQYFDPVIKNCRTALTQSAVNFFCQLYPNTRSPNPLNCAQYINCNPRAAQLIECGYPRLFNATHCVDPRYVVCGTRFEPIAPCDYAQNNHCPASQPNCAPCEARIPSCIGLPDGEVPFPNRPPDSLFVKCKNNRTISVIKCKSDLFNPFTGTCGGNFTMAYIQEVCMKYPTAVFADPSWCSRYYDCQQPYPLHLKTPYLRECKYPQLFDIDKKCTNIFETATTTVSCGNRYEPPDACQYFEHCGITNYPYCSNCTALIPSCTGREDKRFYNYGDYPHSREYFFCYRGRTVLYGKCREKERFDVLNRGCLPDSIPLGTIIRQP